MWYDLWSSLQCLLCLEILYESNLDTATICALGHYLFVNKSLLLSKLKEIAEDNFDVAQSMFFFFNVVENSVEKGGNAGYRNFLLFPQYFVNPFPNKPWFLRVCSTSLLKTLWEKEKLLVTSNFSFSRSVFYPFGELSAIFIKSEIVVCKVFQFGKGLKFFVWERVKSALCIKGLFWVYSGLSGLYQNWSQAP